MKKLFPLSAFRILILLLLNFYLFHFFVFLISIFYLWFISKKDALLLFTILLLIFLRHSVNYPLINEGIVIEKKNNQYIIQNDFYQMELISEDALRIGEQINYEGMVVKNYQNPKNVGKLSKNIFFLIEGKAITHSSQWSRMLLRSQIFKHQSVVKAFLLRFLCGEFQDELPDGFLLIGFGVSLIFYHFKKTPFLLAIFLFLHSWFFGIRIPFIFLYFHWIRVIFSLNKCEELLFIIIFCIFIQPYFLYSKTFVLMLIIGLMSSIELPFNSGLLFLFFQMFSLQGVYVIRSLFWKQLRRVGVLFYFLSFFVLFFTFLDSFMEKVIMLLEKILANFEFFLPGKLNGIWIIFFILFLCLYSLQRKRISAVLLILLLCCRVQTPMYSLHFIDVGQGDSMYFEDRYRNFSVLIDTGDAFHYKKLKSFLYSLGVRKIDVLILSHDDADHAANKENLQQDFEIKEVIDNNSINSWQNDQWFLLKSDRITDDFSENDKSLVYFLSLDNRAFLFTGDISQEIERDLARKYGPMDIFLLKSPHHGSKTSSSQEFLDAFSPSLSSISTSGKYYHPSPEVLDRYQRNGIQYFITKEEGTIHFLFFRFFDLLYTDSGKFIFFAKSK